MEVSDSTRTGPPLLRFARRARNGRRDSAHVDELWCECARATCDAMVPAGADAHRRENGFIVVPRHVDGDRPVVMDDRFVVVVAR